jgi:hypothetical protein
LYSGSIDIFAFGVVTIFAIGENFPCNLLSPVYVDKESELLVPRSELERRRPYMEEVNKQLRASGQLREDHLAKHPLIRLIQQCLHNLPAKRPGIREVLRLLEEVKAGYIDEESERNKRELVRSLQAHPSHEDTEFVQAKDRELTDTQERLGQKQKQIQEMGQQVSLGHGCGVL